MLQLDQVQHQVERRRAARTGVAVAIDAEYLVIELDARKFFAERRQVLPMDRGAVVVEEARTRERIAAGAQRAERNPPLREAAKRREQGRRYGFADIDAAADEQDLHLADLVEGDRRREVEAAACEDRSAIEARERPLVNVLAHDAVGHAQRLDRVRNRDQRVIRQGQEGVPAFLQDDGRNRCYRRFLARGKVCHRRHQGCLIPTERCRFWGCRAPASR